MKIKTLSSIVLIAVALFFGTATAKPFRGEIDKGIIPVIITLLLTDDDASGNNTVPEASAGNGMIVTYGSVMLDASGSSDDDGDVLSYHWSFLSRPDGSAATIIDPEAALSSFSPDQPGRYQLQLIVRDSRGGERTDIVSYVYLPCTFKPQHFQLQLADAPAVGDPVADYIPGNAAFPGQLLGLDLVLATHIEAFLVDLDGNAQGDLVLRFPGSVQFQVWLSDAGGMLTTPVEYDFGSAPLTALAVGSLVGDDLPDIVVADSDGEVRFFEGMSGGGFAYRSTPSLTETSEVLRLAVVDLDKDGDDDLLLSTENAASMHLQDYSQASREVIQNGDFSRGLSFWTTQAVGHALNQPAGTIELGQGGVVLFENGSFRTTLEQRFVIPDSPDTLSFDLSSVVLDDPQGGIPDAFEVSLLDTNLFSLVPTIEPNATAFLNFNPGGENSLASGVTMNDSHVTVDISHAAPGTMVSLYFDLIGNPPGEASSVVLGNIDAGTLTIIANSFTSTSLGGPFSSLEGVGSCDIDSDNLADIILRDAGSEELLIYSLDQDGNASHTQTISLDGIGGSGNE